MTDYYQSKASLPIYNGVDIILKDDDDYLDDLITDFGNNMGIAVPTPVPDTYQNVGNLIASGAYENSPDYKNNLIKAIITIEYRYKRDSDDGTNRVILLDKFVKKVFRYNRNNQKVENTENPKIDQAYLMLSRGKELNEILNIFSVNELTYYGW
jgi:hypothetical protein